MCETHPGRCVMGTVLAAVVLRTVMVTVMMHRPLPGVQRFTLPHGLQRSGGETLPPNPPLLMEQ